MYKVKYTLFKDSCQRLGNEKFFNRISKLFPKLGLYTMSMDWYKNPRYILKFKGTKGDVIFCWKYEDIVVKDILDSEEEWLNFINTLEDDNVNKYKYANSSIKQLDEISKSYSGKYLEDVYSLKEQFEEVIKIK